MEYLMENTVIPYLRKRFNLQRQIIRYRVLRACGLGESGVGHQIKDLMKESKNPSVGTLASIGDIRIRITAKADSLRGSLKPDTKNGTGNSRPPRHLDLWSG